MKKHENFLLTENVFTKVIHFLDRARLNVSNLFYSLYNYYKNFVTDSNLVDRYKERIRSRNISYLDQEELLFYSEPKNKEIFNLERRCIKWENILKLEMLILQWR